MENDKKGFTLLEIMVTVALIGLLATLGTMATVGAVANSRQKTAESELRMISTAVQQLAWDTGYMPNGRMRNNMGSQEVSDLSAASSGLRDIQDDAVYSDEWQGPYYLESFVDPWGNNYFFDPDYYINGKKRPVVGSFGSNQSYMNDYDDDNVWVAVDTLSPECSED